MKSLAQGPNQTLRDAAKRLCGAPIVDFELVHGGANSRLYRVTTGDDCYALKVYPAVGRDARDRLGTEVAALNFLARHGVGPVPGLIAAHPKEGLALYEWVEGPPVHKVTSADLGFALDFARSLHELRAADGAARLPLASEACLSGLELVRQIETRLNRLQGVGAELHALDGLLEDDFVPTFHQVVEAAHSGYAGAELDFEADLPR